MYRFLVLAALVFAFAKVGDAQSTGSAKNASQASYTHASYTKDQADRGKALYDQNCSKCHAATLKGNCPAEDVSSAAYVCSAAGSAPPLVGPSFLKRWYTVADLYGRVQWTMPLAKVNTLSPSALLIGFWFLIQLFSQVGSVADVQSGGVAYGAHVGGFIFGAASARVFERFQRVPEVEV